jgi:hypothetical protein
MEPTPTRAALDAWLVAAEVLLEEQRQHSISPSNVKRAPRDGDERSTTLGEVESSLTALLERLLPDPGRWILILEDGRNLQRYVQCIAFEDGSLVAETASDHFLVGGSRWAPESHATLRHLGWSEPEPPKRPNWSVVYPTRSPSSTEIAGLITATLRQVLALGHRDPVVVKLHSSPRRGATPASESPLADEGHQGFEATAPTTTDDGYWLVGAPWADYYRSLFPGYTHPRSGFDAWKYKTTAVAITEGLWEVRERAVRRWKRIHGLDPGAWPVAHPPAVLWIPWIAHGACVTCTWIDVDGTGDVRSAGRRA